MSNKDSLQGGTGSDGGSAVADEDLGIRMKCMVTKKPFHVKDPNVVQLKNGRHAYCVKAPWSRADGSDILCYKFAPKPKAPVCLPCAEDDGAGAGAGN